MNKIINRLLTLTLGASILITPAIANAESKNSNFVNLRFTINSKNYTSNNAQKNIDIAPFIENDSTLVPFRPILEELGYKIKWNDSDSSIIAMNNDTTMKLFINKNVALVNGEYKKMSTPPKIVGERTVVPLRFISENSGANVIWNDSSKTINITKIGQLNTGNFSFYEEKYSGKNTVYLYTGKDIKTITLENKNIINWYSYNGQILATIFDNVKNKNSIVLFQNESYTVLADNFDIKDTFEFNNNLLIHGYDRVQKINKLLRFDGSNLIPVQTDFYVGKHFIFKDKLIISKYNTARNYSLVVFDKNSWQPTTLLDNFVLSDNLECGNTTYLSGTWQSGKGNPLVSYDGTSLIALGDLSIKLKECVPYNGNLYGIDNSQLVVISRYSIQKALFPTSSISSNGSLLYAISSYTSPASKNGRTNDYPFIRYNARSIALCNNKLYIGLDGGSYVNLGGVKYVSSPTYKDSKGRTCAYSIPSQLIEVDSSNNYKIIQSNLKVKELRTENNKLIILGMQATGTNSYNQPILYVYNNNKLISALDVSTIKNTATVNDNTFIYVKEKLRINNKERDNILLVNNDKISNLAADIRIDKWYATNNSLVFTGYDQDIRQNKLYLYNGTFSELEGDYSIRYYAQFDSKLFINGYNNDTRRFSLYNSDSNGILQVKNDLEVKNIIKLNNNYYLVYGYDRSASSTYKKVLYIYDDSSKEFIEIKTNIEISDMLFIK